MREVDEEGLKEIKDLLEHGEEMDYSILGYNTSNKADYFPIKSENEQYKRMFVETAVLSYKK